MTAATTDPLNFFWFLPTSGDGPYLGTDDYHRPPDNTYLRDIAIAADRLGFGGVLIPTGANCEDPWITAASIAPFTERLKFLVAIRPGIASPAFYARQTAALDRLSNGRALVNIVVGGNPNELAGDGVFLPHDERYNHAREFFDVWQKLIAGERVQYEGKHIVSKGARLNFAPVQKKPPLYFGGSSDAAIDFAGERVEKYLTWGEPPTQVAEKIAAMRAAAEKHGREVSFGIRLHFIVRETDAEAWAAADKLISRLDEATIIEAQERFARGSDSVGQKRMIALHNGRRDQAGGRTHPLGRHWPACASARARRLLGHAGDGRRAHSGVSGDRHRYDHRLRLSASRGSLQGSRIAVPGSGPSASSRLAEARRGCGNSVGDLAASPASRRRW